MGGRFWGNVGDYRCRGSGSGWLVGEGCDEGKGRRYYEGSYGIR